MKRDDWKRIEGCVRGLARRPASDRFDYDDADIVLTLLWGCYLEKPVRWSCQRHNWPVYHTRPIPGESTMSRRLRTAGVLELLESARVALEAAGLGGLVRVIDGKVLPVAAHSRDRDAGFGGRRGRRRGYEMHSSAGLHGLAAWVRGLHRVRVWIAGKLLLDAARRAALRERRA